MADAIFRITINFLIAAGTALIILLMVKKVHYLEEELDQFYHPDTTMVAVSDTTAQQFILSE